MPGQPGQYGYIDANGNFVPSQAPGNSLSLAAGMQPPPGMAAPLAPSFSYTGTGGTPTPMPQSRAQAGGQIISGLGAPGSVGIAGMLRAFKVLFGKSPQAQGTMNQGGGAWQGPIQPDNGASQGDNTLASASSGDTSGGGQDTGINTEE